MEEEGIGLVLARATELRLKISHCIHKATTTNSTPSPKETQNQEAGEEEEEGVNGGKSKDPNSQTFLELGREEEDDDEEDEEAERLFNIREALESLEAQLASLQALQHQQRYEREVALAGIDYSRKVLLEKLKEYKGEDLDVIQEASAFAGETVEHNNDLLLPPYPIRPTQALVLDNGYLSHVHSTRKPVTNGVITGGLTNEAKKNLDESDRNQRQTGSKNSRNGLGVWGHVISFAAKMVLPLVGVISVLSLSGFGPNLGKRSTSFKFVGLFQPRAAIEESRSIVQCPPGKVLVMESGEARCLVKERVEIPFELVVAKPDVNYGCG